MKYVLLFIFSILFVSNSIPSVDPKVEKLPLTKQTLVQVLRDSGIQHIDIVLAQAILESGTFTSNIFKTKNNLFGMKVPGRRETTAINKKGYASYSTWLDSVRDYKLYQDYVTKNKNVSRSKYLSIISRSYSGNPEYVSILNKIIKQNKQYIL